MNTYEPHQTKLAHEIARTLNDWEALPFYLSLTQKHSEDFLRKKLNQVMKIDESKIRKTRGALFTFFVGQKPRRRIRGDWDYDDEDSDYGDPGN